MSTGTDSSPPFSVIEFGNLVALSLETDLSDRFTESFLQFDPELQLRPSSAPSATQFQNRFQNLNIYSPTAPCKGDKSPTSWSSAAASLTKLKSKSTKLSTTHMESNSSWSDASPSRPRLILDKIKHKASALVLRTSELADKQPTRSHASQTKPTLTAPSRHSFFNDDEFAPYLPPVVQYERSLASSNANAPQKSASVGIFSRPASLVTAPPSPTKSNKSIRSFSTTSSAAPVTPTHDIFAPRPSISAPSPDAAFAGNRNTSRWSLCTDESMGSSQSLFSYPNHPFASTHDVTGHDPFAKGHVQVVRHSAHSGEYYAGLGLPSNAYLQPSPKQHKRRTPPAPVPAPQCPLPTPPPSETRNQKGRQNQKVLRIRVAPATAFSGPANEDWTLSLPQGVTVPRSPRTPTSPSPPQSPGAAASASQLQVPETRTRKRTISRSRSFLSTSSSSHSSSESQSHCPSAWHPSPPPSPTAASSTIPSFPPPPRPTRSSSRPPRTADSTSSTESTDSTATITPRQRHHERALATLNGAPSEPPSVPPSPVLSIFCRSPSPSKDEDMTSEDSGPYYSARSSFSTTRSTRTTQSTGISSVNVSQNFGSAWGCRVSVRVRADSGVRPF
ncbi:hypothetical protein DXG01_009136 [Tephrocybe rancida]|nr:hypothetical protein DXG01_009136 [Tephrocybe rancida]